MKTITQIILVAVLGVACLSVAGRLQPAAARQAHQQNPPCEDDARFREFDFWIGHWAVDNAQGQRAGTNLIEKQENGCLLLEKWTGGGGGTGTSMNYFDTAKGKWVQVWVSSAGYSIHIEGGLEDGNMVLTGHLIGLKGKAIPFRGTWTPLPDGRVRQFFEQSSDGGATWTPWFDGYYTRMEDTDGG
jgi:hypothetical protein